MPPTRIKRSNTSSAVPASLEDGEIAINQADGRLYYHTSVGGVSYLAGGTSSGISIADADARYANVSGDNITGAFSIGGSAVVVTSDSRLSDARTPTSHSHGNLTNAGAIGSTSGLPVITTTSGVLTTGTFGSTAGTFCQGNDPRLSGSGSSTIGDGSVITAKLADGAVTYAKIQNVSATDKLLGRSTAGAGVVEEIACTSVGRSVISSSTQSAARTALGLSTVASSGLYADLTGAPNVTGSTSFFAANNTPLAVGAKYVSTGGAVYFGATSSASFPDAAISNAFGSTLMVLQNGGNVGIGVSSPATKLDVRRNYSYVSFCDSYYMTAAFGPREVNDGYGTIIYSWDGYVTYNYWQEDYSSGLFTLCRVAGGVNSGSLFAVSSTGNVGIGTTTPVAKLDVRGSAALNPGSWGAPAVTSNVDSRSGMWFPAANSVAFSTNGGEQVRIDSAGRVGIGTSSPTERLYVAGAVRAVDGIVFGDTTVLSPPTFTSGTLSDYEEGAWTPRWIGTTTTPACTYNTFLTYGIYTKVGRQVFLSARLLLTAYSGGSGSLRVTGVPFPVRATTDGYACGFVSFTSGWSGQAPSRVYIDAGTNQIIFRIDVTSVNQQNIPTTYANATSDCIFSLSYITDI
jgi:hypothetical protein